MIDTLLLIPEDKETFNHYLKLEVTFTDRKNPTVDNTYPVGYITLLGGNEDGLTLFYYGEDEQPKITEVSVVDRLVKVKVEFTYRGEKYTAVCDNAFVVENT